MGNRGEKSATRSAFLYQMVSLSRQKCDRNGLRSKRERRIMVLDCKGLAMQRKKLRGKSRSRDLVRSLRFSSNFRLIFSREKAYDHEHVTLRESKRNCCVAEDGNLSTFNLTLVCISPSHVSLFLHDVVTAWISGYCIHSDPNCPFQIFDAPVVTVASTSASKSEWTQKVSPFTPLS